MDEMILNSGAIVEAIEVAQGIISLQLSVIIGALVVIAVKR